VSRHGYVVDIQGDVLPADLSTVVGIDFAMFRQRRVYHYQYSAVDIYISVTNYHE